MGEHTHISWADKTLNFWEGCTKVSVGAKGACEFCYAENEVQNRFHRALWGNHPRRRTAEANWRRPYTWEREAVRTGISPFVFVNSLSDFWDNQVDPAWRREALEIMRATPHVTYLLLTKRPQNIVKLFEATMDRDGGDYRSVRAGWPPNAAIGATMVTVPEVNRDAPHLVAARNLLRPAFCFVSAEPLMEDIGAAIWPWLTSSPNGGIDWVITGGETDQGKHKARPAHPDWFRGLRDQCAAAGVAYHHKQHGEWVGEGFEGQEQGPSLPWGLFRNGDSFDREAQGGDTGQWMARVGKKRAGRALDGVIHDARPEAYRK